MAVSPALPHVASPSELQAQLEADRAGAPYLLYRRPEGQRILRLPHDRDRVTIGRSPATDVALDWDTEVSRAYAQLELVGEDWIVVDDGLSRNGTFVNGRRLAGRRRLAHGDAVRVGGTLLVFRSPLAGLGETVPARDGLEVELTGAQQRVLVALCRPCAEGRGWAAPASNRAIAAELFVSVETVKTHVRALFAKLAVEDLPASRKRARLVERAFELGLVSPRQGR